MPEGRNTTSVVPEALLNKNLNGILWMVVYTVAMSGMHASIRYISDNIHPFEVAFFRLIFGLLVLIPFFYRQGFGLFKTNRKMTMTIRGIINAVCMMGYFYALSIGPLARVTSLGFSSTLFAIVLAIFIFGEKAGLRRWSAIAFGFIGTLVIVRPGFADVGLETIVVLCSAFGWAICILIIKDLGKTDSAATITAYMSLVMAPIVLIPSLFVWTTPTPHDYVWLIIVGVLGGVGQFSMAQALKQAEAHVVLPVEFIRLIWISILAYLIFGETPGVYEWIGGGMIIAATSYITLRENKLNKKGDTKTAAIQKSV